VNVAGARERNEITKRTTTPVLIQAIMGWGMVTRNSDSLHNSPARGDGKTERGSQKGK